MFPSTAQKSGTKDAFNLCFEDFLTLQPSFLAQKYIFWSLDPCREYRLSHEETTAKPVGAGAHDSPGRHTSQ